MIRILLLFTAGSTLCGCEPEQFQSAAPLVFGQGVTVGVSAGSSTTTPGTPEFTVGVKQADIAVVPTTAPLPTDRVDHPVDPNLAINKDIYEARKIRGYGDSTDGTFSEEDALSTFGSFSQDTSTNCVKLGVFFATGVAAQKLAEGFQSQITNPLPSSCAVQQKTEGDDTGNGDD